MTSHYLNGCRVGHEVGADLRLRVRKLSGDKWAVSVHHPDEISRGRRPIPVGEVRARTEDEAKIKAIKLNKKKNVFSPLEYATFGAYDPGFPGRETATSHKLQRFANGLGLPWVVRRINDQGSRYGAFEGDGGPIHGKLIATFPNQRAGQKLISQAVAWWRPMTTGRRPPLPKPQPLPFLGREPDLVPIKIEYAARLNVNKNKHGWIPGVWVNDRRRGDTWSHRSYDEDVALDMARVMAVEESERYGGDWDITITPRLYK